MDKSRNKSRGSNRYLLQSKYLETEKVLLENQKNILKNFVELKKMKKNPTSDTDESLNTKMENAETLGIDYRLVEERENERDIWKNKEINGKNMDTDVHEDAAAHPTTFRKYENVKEQKKEDNEYVVLKRKYNDFESAQNLFDENAQYPNEFPHLYKNLNGYIIDENGFSTLSPYKSIHQYLDDSVINAYFSQLPSLAQKKNLSLLCFDTLFYDKIFRNNNISEGFLRWAKKERVMEKNIWLIPINNCNHWTLLMVIHNEKTMVYFDSLHNHPESIITDAICTFIQNEREEQYEWQEWNLYIPQDTPSQVLKEFGVGGNCGVHVCIWALILATYSYIDFKEDDIQKARVAIANIFYSTA